MHIGIRTVYWTLVQYGKCNRAYKAAAHVDQYATVEGVLPRSSPTSGDNFLNIGAVYPNQTFTGWIPRASPVNKSPILAGIEGKHVRITGRIEMYKGKSEIRINAASQLEIEPVS